MAADFESERSTRSLSCQINSLTEIVCLYYVNFVAKINKLELPFYDIFALQKVLFLKISDDVIACDLWFGPLPTKNPGYVYAGVM